MEPLTAQKLRELLDYNPTTGFFTWRIAKSKRVRANERAGSISDQGYLRIRVDGRRYLAHRLAWLWMTGEWPRLEIDHRDSNRANNRWSNLREATRSQNCANRRQRGAHPKGTVFRNRRNRFEARIGRAGQFLGYFNTAEEAHVAYKKAAADLHGEFARSA